MRSSSGFNAGVGVLAAILSGTAGCGLTPVAPPSAPTITAEATKVSSAVAPKNGPADSVAVSGFSDYERAALRIRNVGCGGVSSGSGFAIAENVFVTNRHVIEGADLLQVSTYDGHDLEVSTAGSAVVADLALVWTKETLPATIALAPKNPAIGTNVTAVGYPLGGPLITTEGVVLGYAPDVVGQSSLPMLVNDAPIEHGSSGSPLIDDQGRLVGVVYASDGDHYAVPVEILREVLASPENYSNAAPC